MPFWKDEDDGRWSPDAPSGPNPGRLLVAELDGRLSEANRVASWHRTWGPESLRAEFRAEWLAAASLASPATNCWYSHRQETDAAIVAFEAAVARYEERVAALVLRAEQLEAANAPAPIAAPASAVAAEDALPFPMKADEARLWRFLADLEAAVSSLPEDWMAGHYFPEHRPQVATLAEIKAACARGKWGGALKLARNFAVYALPRGATSQSPRQTAKIAVDGWGKE